MKTMKIKKIVLILGMAGITSIGNAQWSVNNINDQVYYPKYFGPTGIFTQVMGQMLNSVKASVDQVATLNEVARKQAVQFQQDTDARNRGALGQAAIAAKNASIFPTLLACADLTKRGTGPGASASAARGGGTGGTPKSNPKDDALKIVKESEKQVLIIAAKQKLGTCSKEDIDAKVAGCAAPGKFSGTDTAPSSDLTFLSLKGNTNNSEKKDSKTQEFANFTVAKEGIDVANQYISNATLYNAPKMIPTKKLESNPAYKALYDGIMVKLHGAQQAMKDILALRNAPKELNSDSLAGQYWEKNKSKYEEIFGMTAPKTPSMMDLIHFTTANDYIGIPDDTAENEMEILKGLDKKIALNNYIASKQLMQQENTNILLSLMLTQAVTPSDVGAANAQYNTIMGSDK